MNNNNHNQVNRKTPRRQPRPKSPLGELSMNHSTTELNNADFLHNTTNTIFCPSLPPSPLSGLRNESNNSSLNLKKNVIGPGCKNEKKKY